MRARPPRRRQRTTSSRAGADVAVVGAGIVGLATADALSELGVEVTVYERGLPGNAASGGESRIFRHAHEDPRLVRFAREAREAWREWEERFGRELLSGDGVVSLGPAVPDRLALLQEVGGIRARSVDREEIAHWLPVLSAPDGPAMLDEDGGAIRTRSTIEALTGVLRDRLRFDEVVAVRPLPGGRVELRAGGGVVEHGRVVVCAGRGTAALALGAGVELPVSLTAQVRLAYRVRGPAPARLACLLDGSCAFGGESAYADPLPGNRAYAVGAGHARVADGGALLDPAELARATERNVAYVTEALPGLDPEPLEARHCWSTSLPWHPDAFAVWEAGGVLVLAGDRLFKHAPRLGRALADAALGGELDPRLEPEARLGPAQS